MKDKKKSSIKIDQTHELATGATFECLGSRHLGAS